MPKPICLLFCYYFRNKSFKQIIESPGSLHPELCGLPARHSHHLEPLGGYDFYW